MSEFTGGNENIISVGEPIVFENKTESNYEVCAGIVFHNSGIYEVSVDENRTIVSKVSERKTGKYHDPFGNPIYVYVRVGDKTVAIKADDLQKALDHVTEHGEEVSIEGRREVDGM